jgi:hypothetical protein
MSTPAGSSPVPSSASSSSPLAIRPYEFHRGDYEQILDDTARLIAPESGWRPAATPAPA